uniref:Seipin n=1 Tax=Periophthalmus magnuspinnatus TaxID=409849 RepID=A0A3B3ZMV0_9GOBI
MEHEGAMLSADEVATPINRLMLKIQKTVSMTITQARQRILQGFVVFSVTFFLLWIAAFLYGSFYYSYLPKAAYSTPVHYYYRTDCESPDSFIKIDFFVLTFSYRMSLQLEMPESPVNQDLGMFMIRATCFSQDGGQVASSARAGMLRYRSELVRTLETLLLLPAFLTATAEQKQVLEVELFSEYTDDPVNTAIIEILSNKVQIYSSRLLIHAHFTGLRYLLFNFPLISAVVGVSSNFIFLSALFVLKMEKYHDGKMMDQRTLEMCSKNEYIGEMSHQRSSPHPILSKLLHSSTSSSCSSMCASSGESDEVFSDGEGAVSKRKMFKKVMHMLFEPIGLNRKHSFPYCSVHLWSCLFA